MQHIDLTSFNTSLYSFNRQLSPIIEQPCIDYLSTRSVLNDVPQGGDFGLQILYNCYRQTVHPNYICIHGRWKTKSFFRGKPNIEHVDGLVQYCSNSIANALELLQSCSKPSMWSSFMFSYINSAGQALGNIGFKNDARSWVHIFRAVDFHGQLL